MAAAEGCSKCPGRSAVNPRAEFPLCFSCLADTFNKHLLEKIAGRAVTKRGRSVLHQSQWGRVAKDATDEFRDILRSILTPRKAPTPEPR